MVVLVFIVTFSLFYASPLAISRPQHQGIPAQAKTISQIEALEIALKEAKRHYPETTDLRLYFPFYNFSSEASENNSGQRHGGYMWSLAQDIRQHPELLQLRLSYFNPNGTVYYIDADTNSASVATGFMNRYCATQDCDRQLYFSLKDRLAYLLDIAVVPRGLPLPMMVDAETGKVVWNPENRLPFPKGVEIYQNITNARTIKELLASRLNPPSLTIIEISEGAATNATGHRKDYFEPQVTRAVLELSNKVVWVNKDSVGHTVTSDNGYSNGYTGKFDSGVIKPTGIFEYPFIELGKYQYHCEIHPWMRGEIDIVENFS